MAKPLPILESAEPDAGWMKWGPNKKAMDLVDQKSGQITTIAPLQGTIYVPRDRIQELRSWVKSGYAEDEGEIPIRIVILDPKKQKREPLTIDKLLAVSPPKSNNPWTTPGYAPERIRNYLYEAKRFVLNSDAVEYAAQIARDHPDWIARNIEFALPSFPKMYIELPFPPYYRTVTGREPDEDGDQRIGYLYVGPRIYIITEGNPKVLGKFASPEIMPWSYWLNRPYTLEEEVDVVQKLNISRLDLDRFMWGESYDALDDDQRRTLRAYHSVWMIPEIDEEMQEQVWPLLFRSSSGDMRNAILFALLLNRSSEFIIEDKLPHKPSFIHNKPRTFLSHSVVRFSINPVPRIVRSGGYPSGVWRREHDVRGHYCRNAVARAAESGRCGKKNAEPDFSHDWREYGVNQWRCMKCGGMRWWRKECKRGTREKGKVKTQYEVSA